MKVIALAVALVALAGCKEDPAAGPPDPCVEARELYVVNARKVGQEALATITDPTENHRQEEALETELRGAQAKFPAICAEIGGERLRRCLRMLRASEKTAFDQADFANDEECRTVGDTLYQKLYGAPPP